MSDIKRPAIPATSGVTSWESLRRFLEPVKILLEIHEGWRGRSGVDRFVPEGELDTMFNRVASMDISAFVGNDTDPPGPPTDMLVTANVWGNLITWTNPTDNDLSHIEVWINTVDSVTEADLVGVVTVPRSEIGGPGQYLHFPSNLNADHYYWIRAVDWSGNYSTWVPTEAMGGFLAPAMDTVGQTIDKVMEILQGSQPVYSDWNIATTYEAGNRVVHGGRTWECYNAVTGVAPTDATGSNYWFRVGILIEGDVDGIPTVGIDGNAVVDGTLLARSIKTDELIAGDNIQIKDGSIYIAGLATETGNWIQGVEDLADDAYDLADGKIKVFRQTSIPTSVSAGDLWVDTDDGNKLYRAGIKGANEIKVGEWVAVQDAGAAYALLGLNSSGLITKAVQASLLTGITTPSSPGLYLTAGYMGYYSGSGGLSGWTTAIKNDGKFWFGKDSNNYFSYNGTDLVFSTGGSGSGFRILNGGSLYVYSGGDVVIEADNSDPGHLLWQDSNKNYQFHAAMNSSSKDWYFWYENTVGAPVADGDVIFGKNTSASLKRVSRFEVFSKYAHIIDTKGYASIIADDYVTLSTPEVRGGGVDFGTSDYPFNSVNTDVVYVNDGLYLIDTIDGVNSWRLATENDNLVFRLGATMRANLNSSGDLNLDGTCSENAFSIDIDKEGKHGAVDDIWEMAQSISDAFTHHDGARLHEKLRKEFKRDNGEVSYGKSPSDLIQVLTECVLDLRNNVHDLQKEMPALSGGRDYNPPA